MEGEVPGPGVRQAEERERAADGLMRHDQVVLVVRGVRFDGGEAVAQGEELPGQEPEDLVRIARVADQELAHALPMESGAPLDPRMNQTTRGERKA